MLKLRWILGTIIFSIVVILIFSRPLPSFIPHHLCYSELLGRAFYIILLAVSMCLCRIVLGPTIADRVVSVDIIGFMLVGFCAILTVTTGREWYMDVGMAWALQAFVTILALSKYLEGRGLDE